MTLERHTGSKDVRFEVPKQYQAVFDQVFEMWGWVPHSRFLIPKVTFFSDEVRERLVDNGFWIQVLREESVEDQLALKIPLEFVNMDQGTRRLRRITSASREVALKPVFTSEKAQAHLRYKDINTQIELAHSNLPEPIKQATTRSHMQVPDWIQLIREWEGFLEGGFAPAATDAKKPDEETFVGVGGLRENGVIPVSRLLKSKYYPLRGYLALEPAA